jgi:hypothetical protein
MEMKSRIFRGPRTEDGRESMKEKVRTMKAGQRTEGAVLAGGGESRK